MAIDLTEVTCEHKCDLYIQDVCCSKSLDDFLSVLCSILPKHERKPVQQYFQLAKEIIINPNTMITFLVGYLNKIPVATSSVFFKDTVSGIFDVIVTPNDRGKGFGKAMTLAAMQRSAQKEIIQCILTATNDAKPNAQ